MILRAISSLMATRDSFTFTMMLPPRADTTVTDPPATKRFTSAPVIIFHFSLFSTVCAGLLMIPSFVVPSLKVMGMLLMVGLFAAGGQYLLTYAYQQAPASEVSIYQYSGVVFTALLSYLIFGETLTLTSIVGAIVILAAIFWVFEYSKHKAKEA